MKKQILVIVIILAFITACGPTADEQATMTATAITATAAVWTKTPTITYTPTSTSTQTPTSTETFTPTPSETLTNTPTRTPKNTPTALPGLGVRTSKVTSSFTSLFEFSKITDIDGLPAQEGIGESSYSKMILLGDPYLEKAILEIDFSKENPFFATATWILFLEMTSNGGKEAADWVHDSYPKALQSGKETAVFGEAEVILETKGYNREIFTLTVQVVN